MGFRLISMMKSKPESISGDSILKWHVEFSSLGPSGYNKTAIERVINNQNFELILWDSLKTMLNEYLKSVITSEKEYEKLNNNDWIDVVNKPDNFGWRNITFSRAKKVPSLSSVIELRKSELYPLESTQILSNPIYETYLSWRYISYLGNRNLLSGLNDQMQAMMDYMQVHYDLD
ncbi:MAG: hypothetical protein R2806_07960 [Saprospiraceae bacterium]